jgi:hypothetical protein
MNKVQFILLFNETVSIIYNVDVSMCNEYVAVIIIIMDLQPFFWLLPLFQFLNPIHRTPWTGDQPVAKPLPTHRTT